MTLKPGLAASLAGNVVLAVLVCWLLPGRAPGSDPVAAFAPAEPHQVGPSPPAATASVDDQKVLALARLEAAIGPAAVTGYWMPGADQELTRQMDALEVQRDRIRGELTRRYGAGAAEDASFARLFKPLNARFPYLSSKSQLALLKLQRTRPAPVSGAPLVVRGNGPPLPELAAIEQQQQEYEHNVRAALTPAEWQEYQLRESRTAKQLRASGVAEDERQFRELFTVLQQLDQEGTAAAYVQTQEKLTEILGANRYVEFSAARDPAYGALQGTAAVISSARSNSTRSMQPCSAQPTSWRGSA
jgi:hypothetical protein